MMTPFCNSRQTEEIIWHQNIANHQINIVLQRQKHNVYLHKCTNPTCRLLSSDSLKWNDLLQFNMVHSIEMRNDFSLIIGKSVNMCWYHSAFHQIIMTCYVFAKIIPLHWQEYWAVWIALHDMHGMGYLGKQDKNELLFSDHSMISEGRKLITCVSCMHAINENNDHVSNGHYLRTKKTTLMSRENDHHGAGNITQKYVSKCRIDNKSALVQIQCWKDNKSLSEPMSD